MHKFSLLYYFTIHVSCTCHVCEVGGGGGGGQALSVLNCRYSPDEDVLLINNELFESTLFKKKSILCGYTYLCQIFILASR